MSENERNKIGKKERTWKRSGAPWRLERTWEEKYEGNETKRKGKWKKIEENEQIERRIKEKGRNWKENSKKWRENDWKKEGNERKRKETKGKARKWAKVIGTG